MMFAGLRAEGGRIEVQNFCRSGTAGIQRPTPNVQRPIRGDRFSNVRTIFAAFNGRWALGVFSISPDGPCSRDDRNSRRALLLPPHRDHTAEAEDHISLEASHTPPLPQTQYV